VTRLKKKTAIRRIAVRETGVSRHHGGSTKGPPKPIGPSQHYRIEGFKGGPQLVPIMPRDAFLSDNRCYFSQSGNCCRIHLHFKTSNIHHFMLNFLFVIRKCSTRKLINYNEIILCVKSVVYSL